MELEREPKKTSEKHMPTARFNERASGTSSIPRHPILRLQRKTGNQAVQRLLKSGVIQAKPAHAQPGDIYEQQADQMASLATGSGSGVLQRKCSCGGSPAGADECDECLKKTQVETLLPQNAGPLYLQRFSAGEQPPAPSAAPASESIPSEMTPSATSTPTSGTAAPGLIVDDLAVNIGPGQLKKTDFLAQLRSSVCSTAAEALAGTEWSAAGCPYIDYWFEYAKLRPSSQIERGIRIFAPDTVNIKSASEYIPLVCARVRSAIRTWVTTGRMPEGLPSDLPEPGTGGGVLSTLAGAAAGLAEGASKAASGVRNLFFKRHESGSSATVDAQSVASQLGSGAGLEGQVQARMGSAFGQDFSRVRIHTDAKAAELSGTLDARAFTLGEHVAFGAGEYRPGTLVGDALIAHELAHVLQQRSSASTSDLAKAGGEHGALEEDADWSALGAVASLWSGTKGLLKNLAANAVPNLKSGLQLQRCGKSSKPTPAPTPSPTPTPAPTPTPPPPPPLTPDLTITGLSDTPDPTAIYFDRNNSTIVPSQKAKIPPLAGTTPANKSRSLTLHGFISEDEAVPASAAMPLANSRIGAVDTELRTDGHSGPQAHAPDTTSGIGNPEYREMRKVKVTLAGAPSGVASCAPVAGGPPAGVISCSDPGRFTTAQTKAGTELAHAISKLSAPHLDATTAHLLDTRFGSTPATRAAIASSVKTNLTNLRSHIVSEMAPVSASGSGPGHRCANECLCGPGVVAFNQGRDASATMTLCDIATSTAGFMQEPNVDERAATLIHEGLHGITLSGAPAGSGAHDFSYAGQRLMGVGIASGTSFLDPATALKNNDSYVLFVRLLNGQAVTAGRSPAEADVATGAAMTPSEREQVDRAVAWLEGWLVWSSLGLSNVYDAVNTILTVPGNSWATVCCDDIMKELASRFGLTAPPVLPTDRDKFAVAAINERFERMSGVLYNVAPLTLHRITTGATSWSSGPGRTVNIGDDFYAIPAGPGKARAQLDLLLLKIIEATPGISPAQQPLYVTLVDRLRILHFGGGSP